MLKVCLNCQKCLAVFVFLYLNEKVIFRAPAHVALVPPGALFYSLGC